MAEKKYRYFVHTEGTTRPMVFLSFEDTMLAVQLAMPAKVTVKSVEYEEFPDVKVGDVIKGLPITGYSKPVLMRVERIESPHSYHKYGYKYYGTFLKVDGKPRKDQKPICIYQKHITSVNSKPVANAE